MKRLIYIHAAFAMMVSILTAEPVSEGTYIDLIVVPVGPVTLAEFEADSPPVAADDAKAAGAPAAAQSKAPAKPEGPGGGGSGIRVKELNPAEIPPSAVFVKHGEKEYFQIPCSLNAVGSPVRMPIRDTEIELYRHDAGQASTYQKIGKFTISKTGERLLVLLTKPLKEKKWVEPKVSVFPLPRREPAQLLFVNASQESNCGINVAGQTMVVGPLKPLEWVCPAGNPMTGVDVALAMRSDTDQFLPMFFQSNIELQPRRCTLFISFGVTTQESFRGGKLATGSFSQDDFRAASPVKIGK